MATVQEPIHAGGGPGQSEIPGDAEVGWQEKTTGNDAKYRVKAEDYDIQEADGSGDGPEASGPAFSNVAVNWVVGTQGVPSDQVQQQTSITYYTLKKAPWWSIYTYELTITATDTYDYKFTDASGDTYTLDVWQNSGSHYVQYRSDAPTIVSISGS
ncbi:hypothetical protein F5X68DRAFT_234620 [Plectosphaerella plurivora]|uniref:Uncharacterized protein n=1 Tax=Plectosphaerella plurivora TaxID=936078 RepID=A0A9P8V837_9PEZI|nr:hypothetical protein F5X68DRAFT_234620 [Plectosphaerella plurivora]